MKWVDRRRGYKLLAKARRGFIHGQENKHLDEMERSTELAVIMSLFSAHVFKYGLFHPLSFIFHPSVNRHKAGLTHASKESLSRELGFDKAFLDSRLPTLDSLDSSFKCVSSNQGDFSG